MRGVSILCLLCVLLGGFGCAATSSAGPVEAAPLGQTRQQKLRSQLIGTWWHHSSAARKTGARHKLTRIEMGWRFREDGTGTYYQRVPSVGMEDSRDFEWHLEGANLVLTDPKRGKPTYYRVVKWDGERMTWFNYVAGNYYFLRKGETP